MPRRVRGPNDLISEDAWKDQVVQAAQLFGWLVMHTRPARTATGWRTPIQGDKGFPDLVLVGGPEGRVLFVELKDEKGSLSPDQRRWRDKLLASGAEWDLWRPRDWLDVEAVLSGRRRRGR